MRGCIHWVLLASLLIASNGPALAQPFRDQSSPPAWAYDALAKLAADGLVEGYPDGTFRGDRALTRAEMAVVVARALARVENLEHRLSAPRTPQPGSPQPQVSQADVDLLLRLVAELNVELAALAVRVSAAEEELRAVGARIGTVRVTGTARFRENLERGGGGTPVNGNPLTTNQSADTFPLTNNAQYVFKLNFDASVADQTGAASGSLHFIAAVMTQGDTLQTFNSGDNGSSSSPPLLGTQSPNAPFGNGSFGSLDSAFLDWTRRWGTSAAPSTLEAWLGRFGANPQPNCFADCYPVQFGPFGLLLNDTGATWSDSTADTGVNVADGLRVVLHLPSLADLQAQGLIARVTGPTASSIPEAGIPVPSDAYIFGEDAYGVDVNVRVSDGTRVGVYYVGNQITPPSSAPGPGGFGNAAQWHIYGPGGGSMNPGNTNPLAAAGYHCTAVAGAGITCPAAGNGWGAYLDSDVLHGVHLDVEYAEWNDAVFATSDAGYQLNFTVDLGELTNVRHAWNLQAGYLDYGQNFYPPYGAAEADAAMNDTIYPGNARGVTASMSISPRDKWTVYVTYFGGSSVSNGQPLSEGEVGVQYAFATNAQFWILARSLSINGVEQLQLYRAQIDYYF